MKTIAPLFVCALEIVGKDTPSEFSPRIKIEDTKLTGKISYMRSHVFYVPQLLIFGR